MEANVGTLFFLIPEWPFFFLCPSCTTVIIAFNTADGSVSWHFIAVDGIEIENTSVG